jgi:hypothetical protein
MSELAYTAMKWAFFKGLEVGLKAAIGVEVLGNNTVEASLTQLPLALIGMKGFVPEPSIENKVKYGFQRLDTEIAGLKKNIADLKKDMAAFQWHVAKQFENEREETLWQTMLQAENAADGSLASAVALGDSDADLTARHQRAIDLVKAIQNGPLSGNLANTRLAFLGEDVGTKRVRGLLEVWKEQALREADQGWRGDRLGEIYDLLEDKFTRALLIQVKCARLLIEAHEVNRQNKVSTKGAADFYADTIHPMLVEEVTAFRGVVESLAVNLMPLPNAPTAAFEVPGEIAFMLARFDLLAGQVLGGKIASPAPNAAARKLPELPALAGCWGRILVPGQRWIRRSPGSTEPASLIIDAPGGKVTTSGTLEVAAVPYSPYEDTKGATLHRGYQLYVSGQPRDMNQMLLARFTPTGVIPNLSGTYTVEIADSNGTLARTPARFGPVQLADNIQAPFGTFTMSFTGGAQFKAI